MQIHRCLIALAAAGATVLAGCGSSAPRFLSKDGSRSPGDSPTRYQLRGIASYYAEEFNGRPTASGETYDMNKLTAAHRSLPFNSIVRVVNLLNGKSVLVRINDRGPFKDDRVIDLSLEGARELDMIPLGTAPVQLQILELGGAVN
jgi:rare lipoprotein A